MVEERRQFPKRWPHLTTLYNSSPFIARSCKEVDDWNSLRPLPKPIGGYPPSYDDTYSRDVFASYDPQRQNDKFGRGYAGSNYDAFSTSTYQTVPNFRKKKKVSKTKHFLSCAIGISLMLASIGAIAAVVIVLGNGSDCDAYGDSVWVLDSPYDHRKLVTNVQINYNFTRDFCYEMETAFRGHFKQDHMCGCRTIEFSLEDELALVYFNIDYRKITDKDKNETYVGIKLAVILNKIINESGMPSFKLSYIDPTIPVTKSPLASYGNDTIMLKDSAVDEILNEGPKETTTTSTNDDANTTVPLKAETSPNNSSADKESTTTIPASAGQNSTTETAASISSTVITETITTTTTITQTPPTQAPTASAPTTQAPTTQEPTTQAPTTQVPTTQRPTTTTEQPNPTIEILLQAFSNTDGSVVTNARETTIAPEKATTTPIPQAGPIV